MAEHKVQGGDMLLFIDPTGGTNYDTVVCLTSVSQSDSVSVVDASSACGPDKSPGTVEISLSFEGQHLQDPASGNISGTNLLQLLRAEQTIGWMLSPVSPQAGDEIQEGTGYLSELSSTYSYSEIGVFSGTIQPYGVPTSTIKSSRFSFTVNTDIIDNTFPDCFLDFLGNNYDVNIYWGDGTVDNLTGNSLYYPSHTYPSLGDYTIELELPITPIGFNFDFRNHNVSNISNINSAFGLAAVNGVASIVFQDCNLSSSDVNNILYQCVLGNWINCAIALDSNIPLAPPTGQGITDKATLESNGCTVTVDAAAPTNFSFRVYTNMIISANFEFTLYKNNGNPLELIIHFGDGTSQTITNGNFVNINHIYPALDYYTIEIEAVTMPNKLSWSFKNHNIDNINNLNLLFSNSDNTISLTNCLTTNDVNNILSQLVLIGITNSIIDLYGNTPPAPPTGQGIIDYNTLLNVLINQITTD